MAQTKYTYSIANDTANGVLAADALKSEYEASSIITALDYISSLGDVLDIYTKDALSTGDKTTLDGVVSNHTGTSLGGDPTPVYIPDDKPISQSGVLESKSLRARLIGIFNETATLNQTTDHDWLIPNVQYNGVSKQSYMNGIELLVKDATLGDKITFQVIDKDNVLGYGANFVLDEFGKDWYVLPDKHESIILYKAKLIVGVYIRLKYTSTASSGNVPKFICNLYRHLDQDVDI